MTTVREISSRFCLFSPMNTLINGNFQLRVQMTQMQLDIQSFSYEERHGILPNLTLALADCGGWVLCRKALSASTMEFRLEIQLGSIFDLYVSIVSSGLELTRSGHLALTDLCNCRKNLADAAGLGQIVTVRLEISFLEEMTLQSLLLTASAPA
jgi:hypothetical protein